MDGGDVIGVPELERFFAPDVTCVLVTVLVVTIIKLLGAYNQRQLEYRVRSYTHTLLATHEH